MKNTKVGILTTGIPTKQPQLGADPELILYNAKLYGWNREEEVWQVIGEYQNGVQAITGTGVDNTDAKNPVINGRGYDVYKAFLTQSGSSAPVATVLENTLSADIVWTRGSAGNYVGTLSGAFTANKTAFGVISVNGAPAGNSAGISRTSANAVALTSTTDGNITGWLIEILVYA